MQPTPFRHLACTTDQDVLILTVTVAQVRGDDLASDLQAELLGAIDRHQANKVILDLHKVTDVTSRGFAAMAGLYRDFVKAKGGRVALCGLSPMVLEALAVIRFIDTHGSIPAIDKGDAAVPGKPRAKPLFEIVTPDVPTAVARLRAAP